MGAVTLKGRIPCLCHLGGGKCRKHTLHERAQVTVRCHATDTADARQLLEALGIVAYDGHVLLPDPPPATLRTEDAMRPAPDPWSSPLAQARAGVRPANSTAPDGLRNLPPVAS